jgi:hypothetical protein
MSFLKNSTSVLAEESLKSQLTNTAPVLLLDTYTDFIIAIADVDIVKRVVIAVPSNILDAFLYCIVMIKNN